MRTDKYKFTCTVTPLLGSVDYDYGRGIALDDSGNIYLIGRSLAGWSLPVNAYSGANDVFVVKRR